MQRTTSRPARITTSAASLALVLALASGACSGKSAAPGPDPLDTLAAELGGAECDALQACYGTAVLGERVLDCDALVTLERERLAAVDRALAAGRVVFHADRVDACLTAIRAASCEPGAPLPPACSALFDGTVAIGSPCTVDAECAGLAACSATTECPGVCAAVVLGHESQACSATRPCEPDFFCGTLRTCTRRGAPYAICANDGQCQAGLSCGSDGLCHAPLPTGSRCDVAGTACSGGDVCVDGVCRRKFSGSAGEACDATGDGLACGPGLHCTYAMAGVPGECAAAATSGGPCALAFPDPCPSDEYCAGVSAPDGPFTGTCTALPRSGEACLERTPDYGPQCSLGTECVGDPTGAAVCRPLVRVGGECTGNDQCYSGACLAVTTDGGMSGVCIPRPAPCPVAP